MNGYFIRLSFDRHAIINVNYQGTSLLGRIAIIYVNYEGPFPLDRHAIIYANEQKTNLSS